MRPHEIEYWALRVIDQVNNGQPNEDSRVELKGDWIDHYKAARQIAGHANAARSVPILWLIGVDEKKGVTDVKHEDLADWFSRVKAQFDSVTPLMQDINVRVNDKTVVALLFETERAPFVVKNPVFGQQGGGPVAHEVPWRDGASTRTAKREELIRILSPLQALPNIEVLDAYLFVKESTPKGRFWWSLRIAFYIEPRSVERIVIPFHRCKVECNLPTIGWTSFNKIEIKPPSIYTGAVSSQTIESTLDEVLIYGPGRIKLNAEAETPLAGSHIGSFNVEVDTSITFSISNIEPTVKTDNLSLPPTDPADIEVYRWDINPNYDKYR